jgi:uncharacterized membrane-anchored protein
MAMRARWAGLMGLVWLGTHLPAWADEPPPPAPSAAAQPAAPAQEDPREQPALPKEIVERLGKLKWKTGTVSLKGDLAKLNLGTSLRFLEPDDASFVLVDLWGNPPGDAPLGMVFPADQGPLDEDGWAVVVTYEEDGYVKDDEAAKMDYAALLKDMQESTRESNEERVEEGYPAVTLLGWAEPPHYDAAEKKLFWAKELQFGDSEEHSLNYNVRTLGRRGVLVFNAVADMQMLAEVRTGMKDVMQAAQFLEGHRYADFDPTMDKVATYGIGALIAGKLASKAGLLAGLGVLILKAKKLLILGAVGIASLLGRLRKGKGDNTQA